MHLILEYNLKTCRTVKAPINLYDVFFLLKDLKVDVANFRLLDDGLPFAL